MAQFDEPKGVISFFAGILLLALGIIPLLSTWGVLSFTLPSFILNILPGVAIWVLPILAFLLFVDATDEDGGIKAITIIVGLVFLALGIIQILSNFNVIGFSIPLGATVYQILLAVEGLFLFLAAFAMD